MANYEAAYELAVQYVESATKQPSPAIALLAMLSGINPAQYARSQAVAFIGSIIAENLAESHRP